MFDKLSPSERADVFSGKTSVNDLITQKAPFGMGGIARGYIGSNYPGGMKGSPEGHYNGRLSRRTATADPHPRDRSPGGRTKVASIDPTAGVNQPKCRAFKAPR